MSTEDHKASFIRFLGTGGGDFFYTEYPHVTSEYIPRVRELGGRNLRWAAQLFIAPDTLIDFYDDRQIRKFNVLPDSIRHLFITHCHYDHLNPPAILEFASHLPHPLEVYGVDLVRESLEFYATCRWDKNLGTFRSCEIKTNYRFHPIGPRQSVRIGDMMIAAVHANHSFNKDIWGVPFFPLDHVALNYVIQRNGKTLFYGLDSSYTLPQTLEFLRRFRFDIAVLDTSFGQFGIDPAKSGHHNFEMIRRTVGEFREAGIIDERTLIIGSHMSVGHAKPHDDLVDEAAEKGITLAYDGMTLEF